MRLQVCCSPTAVGVLRSEPRKESKVRNGIGKTVCLLWGLSWQIAFGPNVFGQDAGAAFAEASSKGVAAFREDHLLILRLQDGAPKKLEIPRFAAPLKSVTWTDLSTVPIQVRPEPDRWIIEYARQDGSGQSILLEFGEEPKLLSELQPVQPLSDGSFWLPAHLATTAGEKIRYEPQSFKNTVGYWTGKNDTASWSLELEKPGRFNVAILQGCGAGQGGSVAAISIVGSADQELASLEFEVQETGHFQDFHWRHLGSIELLETGVHRLTVSPRQIAKTALMDVRAIHLIRLPDPK